MNIKEISTNASRADEYMEYSDGRIAVIDNMPNDETYRHQRTGGIVVVLCTDGSMSFLVNGQQNTAHRNDVVILSPEMIIDKKQISGDFKFRCIFVSLDYAIKMLPLSVRSWNFKIFFEQHPRIPLSENGVAIFNRYCDLLKWKLADKSNPYREYIIDGLMQALVFEFRHLFDGYANLTPRPISSAENIFGSFVDMLATSYPKHRNVAYYADKLNITAKYLSVVCKKTSGKNSSKIIDSYVLKDIENLLRNSKKSIKEVSNELAFPNTSFFGRYVKKNFGCTPVELRRRLNGVE